MNTTMYHLHMRRQGLQPKGKTTQDTYLEYNRKSNLVFCVTINPSKTYEGKNILGLMRLFSNILQQNKYIHICYVRI